MIFGFLSTLSLRRATDSGNDGRNQNQFLSTLSLRRATGKSTTLTRIAWISIHALLAESDWSNRPVTMHTWKFLSTLSLRRATRLKPRQTRTDTNFYPRSPCGERHILVNTFLAIFEFLSTLSLRRATSSKLSRNNGKVISIHALLAESDFYE